MTHAKSWIVEAQSRLRVGDLFDWSAIVVTIESGGRAHGAVSKAATRRGVPLPDLKLGDCRHCRVGDRDYVFACLWAPGSEYDDTLVRALTTRTMQEASRVGLEEIAFPLLGGSEAHRFVEVMVTALVRTSHELAATQAPVPRTVIVTREPLVL